MDLLPQRPPAFEPDSRLVTHIYPASNFEERRGCNAPDLLLLHYTAMESAEAAIQWLAVPESKVSCHYVVDEAGVITQMVPERLRAWHAGNSHWHGNEDINSCSIGIEIQNRGHAAGCPEFPDAQIKSVEALCLHVLDRYRIIPTRVLAHSDVAPGRKKDPGEKFPWARIAAAGIGHWVEPAPFACGEVLQLGDSGNSVGLLQSQLSAYGYGIEVTGFFDDRTHAVVEAFQRHFRPALVDGRADLSTVGTLDALLAALPPVA